MTTPNRDRCKRLPLWCLLLGLGLTVWQDSAEAAPPRCSYAGDHLLLRVDAVKGGEVPVTLQPLAHDGRVVGAPTLSTVKLRQGRNNLSFEATSAADHSVAMTLGKQTLRLVCRRYRGSWAAGPEALGLMAGYRRMPAATAVVGRRGKAAPTGLAPAGFRARVTRPAGIARLVVERTFGRRSGYGIRPGPRAALELVVRSNVGAVQVVASRRRGKVLQYWDYSLALEPRFRRYHIPLSAFRFRGRPTDKRMNTLHGVSLRSLAPAKVGDEIAIATLAVRKAAARITDIAREASAVTVATEYAESGSYLMAVAAGAGPKQAKRVAVAKKTRTRLPPSTERVWLCWGDQAQTSCDPPDAPLSTYRVPPKKEAPFLIDDFSAPAQVNAHREIVRSFGSDWQIERSATLRRRPGQLTVSFAPKKATDYFGVETLLPSGMPNYPTLKLQLKLPHGRQGHVTLGLTDEKYRAARVDLGHYLARDNDMDSMVAMVPMQALDAAYLNAHQRSRKSSWRWLALTLVGGKGRRRLVVERIALMPNRAPLHVSNFDGDALRRTAVSGPVVMESVAEGLVQIARHDEGHAGRALAIKTKPLEVRQYALVSFGLGSVDLAGYTHLSFWARCKTSCESIELQLSSGKKREAVTLSDHVQLEQTWQRASVPLTHFSRAITGKLTHLVLVWRTPSRQPSELDLDEIRFQ